MGSRVRAKEIPRMLMKSNSEIVDFHLSLSRSQQIRGPEVQEVTAPRRWQ